MGRLNPCTKYNCHDFDDITSIYNLTRHIVRYEIEREYSYMLIKMTIAQQENKEWYTLNRNWLEIHVK